MAFEKLTEGQIRDMEVWADSKRKTATDPTVKSIIERIDQTKKDNWKGYRLNDGPITAQEAQGQLDRLKEKTL